ncbi:MAG TPA: tail fiber protein [Verrucomicrobiae bacterium]|jgi:microcystin-dependent protein
MPSPYVGEIRLFAGNFAPANWFFCSGQLLPITQYEAFFNLIGTTYGGDGVTTFALPDLRSRVPIHQGNGFVLGQNAGTELVTLLTTQIPSHTHSAVATSNNGSSNNPANNLWANWTGSQYSDQGANSQMNAGALASAGGNQPHENRIPYVALNFIISPFGVFPSPT